MSAHPAPHVRTFRPSLTCLGASVGVDTELQSLAVNVVRERANAMRKASRVCNDDTVSASADLPAIVDNDVFVTRVAHATRCDRIRGFANERFAHVAPEVIPAIPSHRWSERKSVVEH